MSKAMQLLGIILLGMFTLVIIYLMSDVRSTSELDYYLLQEITEASMYDAVDYGYYHEKGQIKVDRNMFLESFNRRFAQSVDNTRDYNIKIVDFNETPPKVSIQVDTYTVASFKGNRAVVTTQVSGIIESIYDADFVYARGAVATGGADQTKPVITVAANGKITFSDNIALEKYAVVPATEMPLDSQSLSKENLGKIRTWKKLNAYPASYDPNLNKNTFEGWVVVVDVNGNWSAKAIGDVLPSTEMTWVCNKNGLLLNGSITDDRGVTGYMIARTNAPDVPVLEKSVTPFESNHQSVYTFSNEKISLTPGSYVIRAKDSKGQIERVKNKNKFTLTQEDYDYCVRGLANTTQCGTIDANVETYSYCADHDGVCASYDGTIGWYCSKSCAPTDWWGPDYGKGESYCGCNRHETGTRVTCPSGYSQIAGNKCVPNSCKTSSVSINNDEDRDIKSYQINTNEYSSMRITGQTTLTTKGGVCKAANGISASEALQVVVSNGVSSQTYTISEYKYGSAYTKGTASNVGTQYFDKTINLNSLGLKGNVTITLKYTNAGVVCMEDQQGDWSKHETSYSGSITATLNR